MSPTTALALLILLACPLTLPPLSHSAEPQFPDRTTQPPPPAPAKADIETRPGPIRAPQSPTAPPGSAADQPPATVITPQPAVTLDEPSVPGATAAPTESTPPPGTPTTSTQPAPPPPTPQGSGPAVQRPQSPLRAVKPGTRPPATPTPPAAVAAPTTTPSTAALATPTSKAPPVTRTITVTEDTAATLTVSGSSLNRILFPDPIVSAYTQTEAIDVILEGHTAIVTFRAARPSDLLVVTQGNQYLLKLTPENLPAQTIRIRHPRPEAHVTSSYQTQLATLIEAGYRRQPPQGFRTERLGTPLPVTGALAWYLTLRHRGHLLSLEEYAVYNLGAFPHLLDPAQLAGVFVTARAISADPLTLAPGTWGRVFIIVDTDTVPPPPEPPK